jgi:hypothetical protein
VTYEKGTLFYSRPTRLPILNDTRNSLAFLAEEFKPEVVLIERSKGLSLVYFKKNIQKMPIYMNRRMA